MKNVYIIQNSNIGFDMDFSKVYSPEKYSLFLIINEFGFDKLKVRKQDHYCKYIWQTDNFEFEHLKKIILHNQFESNLPFTLLTNAEEAVTVCGNLRVFFNIDDQNYDRFINKITMKKLLDAHGLLTPKHVLFDKTEYRNSSEGYINHLDSILSYPLLVKPIDSMGCLGIEKIHTKSQLKSWCDQAVLSGPTYEIDEYIEGKVYNCDSFIKNKKIVLTQVSECSNSCYDFIFGLTKGTIALPHDDPTNQKFCEYTQKVHDAIGIPMGGVTHLEAILTDAGDIYFVEIGHRSPGILIPAMYRKFINIDTIESHILLQIDDDYSLDIKRGPHCAWIAFPTKNGELRRQYIPITESEYELEWFKYKGDEMVEPKFGRDYAGRALMWHADYQQLRNDFYYLNNFKFFD